ncbi:hypothetical protein O6H91_07G121000 [Diphasiastrum complanatum]|uniref:Uncharacterized protein n=2 Tax=Diphasiastrum complanatum TaxID=34168 RepID=A0ACC2D917_DIPCM|nr:hypothetical protein O6H91_07G121000 [Diphasiastrum complanatum]KAJ7550843.1 hypothetical protein O6H91_07G121000 [Diphasiastrum complanatum]
MNSLTWAVLSILLVTYHVSHDAQAAKIVYLGGCQKGYTSEQYTTYHRELLASVVGSLALAKERLVYSYTNHINGFAAVLTDEQAYELTKNPAVTSVFENRGHYLHTTESWKFLGLEDSDGDGPPESLWDESKLGADVIIGSLDTGIWPESLSYNDHGIGPIPAKWKGTCVSGTAFNASNCNRKLIGARFFIKGYEAQNGPFNETASGDFLSPRDKDGHGTHTSSTAGGRFVKRASLFGFASGTAKGGAPSSRIAAYKVCWPTDSTGGQCYDADILAALDQGIADGVDLFTISLGSGVPLPNYFADGIAIGAFHAIENGIPVVCSAGNDGPAPGSVANVAPWILTVAASSIDRTFISKVALGNNATYDGESLSQDKLPNRYFPLVSSADVGNSNASLQESTLCFAGSLDPQKVAGKIVACLRGVTARVSKGLTVKLAGGIGMILANPPASGNELIADPHILPASQLTAQDGAALFAYINSTSSPIALLGAASTILNVKPAPVMASFSSQGPNSLTPDILKPDITGPGVNILAAYAEATSPTGLPFDTRVVKFNVISGTSMSCPHLAGVVALLKALHPTWSPAAIRSAIVTTASLLDNTGNPITDASQNIAGPFNYGAGQVNPNKAADPGLVYDASPIDYLLFLCGLNYTQTQLQTIAGTFVCPAVLPTTSDLNYPSITISNLTTKLTITRTVTNVARKSTYIATIEAPVGISVSVYPSRLEFSKKGQQKTFQITFTPNSPPSGSYIFGQLIWKDGHRHVVRSPFAVNIS